jgi:dolichyl-phosphate beta-glucosyltransferase
MFLSVITPAYNEEKRISPTLESVDSYLKKQNFEYEIIVVANNCQDQTCDIVRNYQRKILNLRLINLENSSGKGKAVKRGVEAAEGDYILFMDADNSTRIREVGYFLPYLKEGYDVVIGSRAIKGARVVIHQPAWRESFGKFANFFIRLILLPEIYDTQCGFKLFRRDAGKQIFAKQKISGFGFDLEVLALARHFGFKIKEMPIIWCNSPGTRVSFWHYFITFWELLKIRWSLWRRIYKQNNKITK